MTEQEKAERFAKSAPPLRDGELEAINALFPAYIFRRSCAEEIWTTCCHEHTVVGTRDLMISTPERNFMAVMYEPHQREPRNRYYEPATPNVECPFCGKPVIVKELRYTGKRENLSSYRRAVALRWYRGALWARAYDCSKHYSVGYDLDGEPSCKLVGVYRFRPGLAEATTRYWWGDCPFTSVQRQDAGLVKGRWHIHGPFTANAEYGMGYDVIGLDEIQESPFRYCMAAEAEQKFTKFLEFLTACCFYPRQIEMLMKAGMSDVVRDLVERGVKHATVINWDEPNPSKAFGLNRQDMKTFLGTDRDIRILELHKKLKGRVPIAEAADWIADGIDSRETIQQAKKWGIAPERLIRYLQGFVGCAHYGGMQSISSAMRTWKDYLTAAEALGYQLHRDNVLMPSNLGQAHDEATERHQEVLQRERRQQERQRQKQERDRLAAANAAYDARREKLDEKYGFAMDGILIRAPINGAEVLDEGRILKHCVGGYADRHVKGAATILFMRQEKHPDKPWLTIEMSGNQLVQIHGFKNEGLYSAQGRFAPDPREVYREFLDTWLDWLKKGSKRDKHGNPKIPRKKKGAAA